LRPVVSALPARVIASFAPKDHCTFGQAKRVIEDLHLPQSVQPYAYAVVCNQSELEKSLHLSANGYNRMRAELVDLFNLSSPDFKIKDLLKERWYDQGNSAHVSLGGGVQYDGGHGGGGADGGHGSSGA
jgi:uncharacterized membrane protein YgcG